MNIISADKKNFITQLLTSTFPVLELLDYVPDENGIYNPRDASSARTVPYVSSFNGFVIPNYITIGVTGDATTTYPESIDIGTNIVLDPTTYVGSNLAFLNVSLQPVYTLELETAEPDTGSIGGSIVL
jgi:hypothetical protein